MNIFDKKLAAIQDSLARSMALKSPPNLPIADWVPEPIARHFRERYYANLDVVTRLVSDKCMCSFYEEMLRKDGDVYVYPARIEGEQTAAVIELLDMVARTAKAVITPLTKAQVKQRYERSMATARLLLEDMDDPWFDNDEIEILSNAAQVYQRQGLERYHHEMRFATLNKSRHSQDRALVIQIADKSKSFSGSGACTAPSQTSLPR
jgi:hypothetical protein